MRATDSMAATRAASSTSTSPPPASALSRAAAAASAATVRMVPWTGRITAPSAALAASTRAVATSDGPADSTPRTTSEAPRRIWERITPELPLAPISDPWATALHTAVISTSDSPSDSSSLATASRVRAMFVPIRQAIGIENEVAYS